MPIALASLVAIAVVVFVISVRAKDLPQPEPVSPFEHLDERKASIYDNLRDLQFEYRVGKLSDADYQQTKVTLQKELAGVLTEMESTAKNLGLVTKQSAPAKRAEAARPAMRTSCPHCGAAFTKPMK